MKYMGGKGRIAKYILPIILNNRINGQFYIEPFVGGCNSIDKVGGNRIANDNNYYLIAMWKALQQGWVPPKLVTEDFYNEIKNMVGCADESDYLDPALAGYVGFNLSFGAKWWGGYRRDKKGDKSIENMETQSRRAYESIMKQVPSLKDVLFLNKDFRELNIPDNSILYCDIPYKNTTGYGNFNHLEFWEWADNQHIKGHNIFVSEYEAPSDWKCVWEGEVITKLDTNSKLKATEKLFTKNNLF